MRRGLGSLVAVVALAGCGSDHKDDASTGAKAPVGGVTRASYIRSADGLTICGTS